MKFSEQFVNNLFEHARYKFILIQTSWVSSKCYLENFSLRKLGSQTAGKNWIMLKYKLVKADYVKIDTYIQNYHAWPHVEKKWLKTYYESCVSYLLAFKVINRF